MQVQINCANQACCDTIMLSEISELLIEDVVRRYSDEENKWSDKTMFAYCPVKPASKTELPIRARPLLCKQAR